MWTMTTYGFFSAVQDRQEPDRLLIQARDRDDLVALLERHPILVDRGVEILDTTGVSDYPACLFLGKGEWAAVLTQDVFDLDYSSFESAVKVRAGGHRLSVYMRVGQALRALTKGRDPHYVRGLDPDDVSFDEYDSIGNRRVADIPRGPAPRIRRVGSRRGR